MKVKYDVCVIGGGTSGVACATMASKLGLKTLLVDKNIHLGGSITSALVVPAMKTNDLNINTQFISDLKYYLKKYNANITFSDSNDLWMNPQLLKIVLDDLLKQNGCDILFDTTLKNIILENSNIVQIELITSDFLSIYIEARYIVDATGKAVCAKLLNLQKIQDYQNTQPATLRFNMSNINIEKFANYLRNIDKNEILSPITNINGHIHLSCAYTNETSSNWALKPIFLEGIKENLIQKSDCDYFQIFTIANMPKTIAFNCPRILTKIDELDPFSKTNALIEARQRILRIANFCIKKFDGFENAYISDIADMLGERSCSRFLSEYNYTIDDILNNKNFENPALHSDYPIDIHSFNNTFKFDPSKLDYYLPINALKAKGITNLYIIGKALGVDFASQAALRVQKSCFSMGEAVAKDIFNNF